MQQKKTVRISARHLKSGQIKQIKDILLCQIPPTYSEDFILKLPDLDSQFGLRRKPRAVSQTENSLTYLPINLLIFNIYNLILNTSTAKYHLSIMRARTK